MGRSLDARIVIGVELGNYDRETFETIEPRPRGLLDRLEDEWEIEEDGLTFCTFHTMEEEAAFGAEVYITFDYVSDFNAPEIARIVDEALPKVKAVFKKWGVTVDPKPLLVLDYS